MKKDTSKHTKFNDLRPARVSRELYEFDKIRFKMDVMPYRLLMMVSQVVAKEGELDFGTIHEWPLSVVFKYLNIENSGQRYDILFKACEEFVKSGLSIVHEKKNGAKRYVGISFIKKYEFAEDYPCLRITVNEEARQFLSQLRQYAQLSPKYYLKLSTEYQNWFYPYLKIATPQGRWVTSIEDLKTALSLDKTPSYTTNKNANEKFFSRVLGIQKPKGKLKPNQEWEYTRDEKTGMFTGTLAGITANTDINVTATPIKTGRQYTHVSFNLSFKTKVLTAYEQDKLHKQATQHDIQDMGKPTNKTRGNNKKPQTLKDLFSSTPVMEYKKCEDVPVPTEQAKTIIPAQTMREMAKLQNTRPDILAKKLGYTKREDGDWEK